MNQIKNIIVGTDFSDHARSALQEALRLAKWNHATIHVLHVVDPLDITTLPEVSLRQNMVSKDLLLAHATRALESWTRAIAGDVPLKLKVALGPPIDKFLAHIRRIGCDLVVLGVHGRNHPDERDLGVLATRVLRKAPCEVLLVTRAQEEKFSRIVACIDFSDTAKEVAEEALHIAERDRSEVVFLHVFGVPSQCLPYAVPELESPPGALKAFRTGLQKRLRSFVPSKPGVPCKYEIVEACSYGAAIAQFARETKADLIVIGTKGTSNLSYVLLGSTAERLVRALPCSALVIKPE